MIFPRIVSLSQSTPAHSRDRPCPREFISPCHNPHCLVGKIPSDPHCGGVVLCGYSHTAVNQLGATRKLRYHARDDNTGCDNVNTWMTCANTLLLLIQTAIQECAVTSLVSMRSVSVCVVSRSVIHVVLRSIPYHNQRVWCLTFCRQRVLVQSRNLAGTTPPRNRLRVAKVTVHQHVGYADIRFLVLTIATYSSCNVTSRQTSSMFFPHPSSRHILQ